LSQVQFGKENIFDKILAGMRNKLIDVYCIYKIAYSVPVVEPAGLRRLFFHQIKLSKFGHPSYSVWLLQ
jgi:hypothetical protein